MNGFSIQFTVYSSSVYRTREWIQAPYVPLSAASLICLSWKCSVRIAAIYRVSLSNFRTAFHFRDSEIVSLYETRASRMARKDALIKWSMNGEFAVLVNRFSARSGRAWEDTPLFLQPIDRNHPDMVKFSEYDDVGSIVGNFLTRFAKAAPAVIRDRIRTLEPSRTPFPSVRRSLASR